MIEKTALIGERTERRGAATGRPGHDRGRVLPRPDGSRTCCCSSTTSSGSCRPAPRSRPCSAGCRARSATSRPWPARWVSCRSGSPRPGPLDHLAAGDLRARRRHHRPGAAHHLRPPGRDHGAGPRDRLARHLPGGRPAGLDLADPRPALCRRGALPGGQRGPGDPAALQRPQGHHRHPRGRRAVRGRQGDHQPGPPHPAVPVPAFLRGRAVPGVRARPGCAGRDHRLLRRPGPGDYDHLPEQAFFNVGGIEEAEEKAKQLGGSS